MGRDQSWARRGRSGSGSPDESGGKVKAPSHPARVRRHAPTSRIEQIKLSEQFSRPGTSGAARHSPESSDHRQVLGTTLEAVERDVLARQADSAAHLFTLRNDVIAGHPGLASVARMRTIVVLPAPLGPSRARMQPAGTATSTSSRTRSEPKDLVRPVASIAARAVMCLLNCV